MQTGTGVLVFSLWTTLGLMAGLPESASAESFNQRECKTYGSGMVQPFNGSAYHVRTSCSVTLVHFTHQSVDCDITAQRGPSGLLTRVEVVVNKVRTVVQNGTIMVENHRVSLPYDHTYQHVFHYGVHTRLRSKVLPLTITWHITAMGIDALWVRLEGNSISGMKGLCGHLNTPANPPQLISEAVLEDDTCVIEDSREENNMACGEFMSHAISCLMNRAEAYFHLCQQNAYGWAGSAHITCPFFWDVAQRCGPASNLWDVWRDVTQCPAPDCPGELTYQEQGNAFTPTCSNPTSRAGDQEVTSTCVCPQGKVLNDRAEGHDCMSVAECPCVYGGSSYPPGTHRGTKCQTCECVSGKWRCSEDICPKKCSVESQFVTSFDGKHLRLPGKCSYVAAQGLNWTLTAHFSERAIRLQRVELKIYHESYVFTHSRVMFQNEEIRELHQTAFVSVFWQSSMFVQVLALSGLSIQVQMAPEIQVYVSLPKEQNGTTTGLCGNFNGDSGDDFTTSSGIVENSAEPFALSWSLESCEPNINPLCINMDSEIFADEHCNQLRDPHGIFSFCHSHVPYDHYYQACLSKTCHCQSGLQSCLCVALGNYAKACASVGASVGDWRAAANCTVTCATNQGFDYATQVCNRTCRSLAGPDPTCELEAEPAEGCGCREGTYLNDHGSCSPRSQCQCHHIGGAAPPGPVVIDGRACTGCYCPDGQYEDHKGMCVSADNCTCVFSGSVYGPGESVETNCKTCTCSGGHWTCTGESCPGRCQVFGNGHYQTFDSRWFSFDGNCQYTLLEDGCGRGNGQFAVRVESIPCCDEVLTCSRTITLDLLDEVSLVLGDMSVSSRSSNTSAVWGEMLYSVHTVGLYIVVSIPRLGLTLIWDKHTRLTVLLEARWRGQVCGLCGNFDSSEANDLMSSGSLLASSALEFGNSWKTGTPPCSDVMTETFPCQRHSYCSNWAERRCMIITGDTFKECHLKVDPDPYYQACVLEACSCEFEGKFLGFCTAVAAYAEACSEQNVCVHWRTPDLCPVFCDYYNREGQSSWHYDPCGKVPTCGRNYKFNGTLEGCYPRCPAEAPYYDENTGNCTTRQNCTCLFNGTVLTNGHCTCTDGTMECGKSYPLKIAISYNNTTNNTHNNHNLRTTNYNRNNSHNHRTTNYNFNHKTTIQNFNHKPTDSHNRNNNFSCKSTNYNLSHNHSHKTSIYYSAHNNQRAIHNNRNNFSHRITNYSGTHNNHRATNYNIDNNLNHRTIDYNRNNNLNHRTTNYSHRTTNYSINNNLNHRTTNTNYNISKNLNHRTTKYNGNNNLNHRTTNHNINNNLNHRTTNTNYNITTNTNHNINNNLNHRTTNYNINNNHSHRTTNTNYNSNNKLNHRITNNSTNNHHCENHNTYNSNNVNNYNSDHRLVNHGTNNNHHHNKNFKNYNYTINSYNKYNRGANNSIISHNNYIDNHNHYEASDFNFVHKHNYGNNCNHNYNCGTINSYFIINTTNTNHNINNNLNHRTTNYNINNNHRTTNTNYNSNDKLNHKITNNSTNNHHCENHNTYNYNNNNVSNCDSDHRLVNHGTNNNHHHNKNLIYNYTINNSYNNYNHGANNSIISHNNCNGNHNHYEASDFNFVHYHIQAYNCKDFNNHFHGNNIFNCDHHNYYEAFNFRKHARRHNIRNNHFDHKGIAINNYHSINHSGAHNSGNLGTNIRDIHILNHAVHNYSIINLNSHNSAYHHKAYNYDGSNDFNHRTHYNYNYDTINTKPTTTTTRSTPAATTATTAPTTVKPITTTVQPTVQTTTPVCECRGVRRNESWPCGARWTEDCSHRECRGGEIVMTPVTCPESPVPACPRGQVVTVEGECSCRTYKCNCRCEVYGDPHYISFQGTTYDFLENCTYTLVRERLPRYQLSIVVDNYFCIPWLAGSCTKGIMMTFRNHTITLSIQQDQNRVAATLNQVAMRPPYEEDGIRFETTGLVVSVYIEEIRSHVSLTPSNTLVVSLAMEHFLNNTEGQCGECGGSSCVRPGGVREKDTCCPTTAADWIHPDPRKPYCTSTPRNTPCDLPPTPTPSTDCPPAPICDILKHSVFAACGEVVDLAELERSCQFDVSCTHQNMSCSVLAQAADECKKKGFCVEWLHLTNGICDVSCPDGLVYQECRNHLDDHCSGSLRMPGRVLEDVRSGCFCPESQLRAGEHNDMCVDTCTGCQGPYGEPMQVSLRGADCGCCLLDDDVSHITCADSFVSLYN
ncbi:uncharacterized protein LOC143136511 [Alosa pseudoharengus]|uniref:uncharacterized protein LOC143136511 n=1 Tax=Alosa pseudoharengus TaxID=34774 RepID=UPI003F8C1AA4